MIEGMTESMSKNGKHNRKELFCSVVRIPFVANER